MKTKKPFFKIYGWLVQHFQEITGSELKVIMALSYKMGFNDNTILMESVIYDMLEEQLQISHRSLLRILRSLEKKGLIKRHSFYLTVSKEFSGKGL